MKRNINDILDECVDAIKRKEKTVEECLRCNEDRRSELEPMLIASAILIENSGVVPDAKSKQETRDRLLAAVEKKRWEAGIERMPLKEGTPGEKRRVRSATRWRRTFKRITVITIAAALLSGTTLAMAQESLPGSPLYPVKLAVEKVRIDLAKDKNTKSQLYLKAAQERISELQRMKKDDTHYPELIKATAENIKAAEKISGGKVDKRLKSILDDLGTTNQRDKLTLTGKPPVKAKPFQGPRSSKNLLKGNQSDGPKMEPFKNRKSTINGPVKPRLAKPQPARPAGNKQEIKDLIGKDRTNNDHKNENQTVKNPADKALLDEGLSGDSQINKRQLDKSKVNENQGNRNQTHPTPLSLPEKEPMPRNDRLLR